MRRGRSVIVAVLIIAAVVGLKFLYRDQASDEMKESVRAVLSDTPSYQQNQEYYDAVIDASHKEAFSACYEIGGRRRASTFDEKKYISLFFSQMQAQAKLDGRLEIAADIAVMEAIIVARLGKEKK